MKIKNNKRMKKKTTSYDSRQIRECKNKNKNKNEGHGTESEKLIIFDSDQQLKEHRTKTT